MKIKVTDRSAYITEDEVFVSGSVAEYTVQFEFTGAWAGYTKTAVFKTTDGGTIQDVLLGELNTAVVPWEVLEEPGYIQIGIYGMKGGQARPTLWVGPKYVEPGAEPYDRATYPASTPWADALTQVDEDKADAEEAAEDAEAYAMGTRNGEAVTSDDPTYNNNSKYYFEAAEDSAEDSEAYAVGKRGGVDVGSSDPAYHNNALYYKTAAETAAASASAAYNTSLLAANYSSEATYKVGDHVIYSGAYYVCNTAIPTAEAWTAAHWTQVNVGGEVSALKSALGDVETTVYAYTFYTNLEHGAYDENGDKIDTSSPTAYLRSKSQLSLDDFGSITINNDYYIRISYYDVDGVFIAQSANKRNINWTKSDILAAQPMTKYITFYVRRYGDGWYTPELTLDEITNDGDYSCVLISSKVAALESDVDSIDTTIAVIKDTIKDVPDYYNAESYFANKIAAINDHMLAAGETGDQFVFITDLHWPVNAKKSPNLIQGIFNGTPVNKLFMNGDYENSTSVKSTAVQIIRNCVGAFDYPEALKYVNVGNHEYNDPSASSSSQRLSVDQVRAMILNPQAPRVALATNNNDNVSFYVDNELLERRYFVIGCNYGSNIHWSVNSWLANGLLAMPENYTAVIISHVATVISDGVVAVAPTFANIAGIIDAYNARGVYQYTEQTSFNFTNVTGLGKVLAVFSGHTHRDEHVITTGGIPIICTTSDAYAGQGITGRTAGTINEQAFDVVTIDMVAAKIYETRIGAGSDREFNLPS